LYFLEFDSGVIKEGDQITFKLIDGPYKLGEEEEVLKSKVTANQNTKIFTFTRGTFPQIYISNEYLFGNAFADIFESEDVSNTKRIELLFRPHTHLDKSTFH